MLAFVNFLTKPLIAVGGSLVIAGGMIAYAHFATQVAPSGTYVAAKLAPIEGLSGATSDLSFQTSGKIVSIPVTLGAHVAAGQTLAVLDHAALSASLIGAQANVEAAQARLAALASGTRPEQVSIYQNTVAQDQVALRNAIRSAYVAADTAVHADTDPLFSNPRTAAANFTLIVPDALLVNRINQERIALEPVLTAWAASVSAGSFTSSDPSAGATLSASDLTQVTAFLDDVATAINETPPSTTITATQLAAYAATISVARTGVTTGASTIASAQAALVQAAGTLALAQAGSTNNDLNAAQAAVDAARASAAAIEVSIAQATLSAPIAGTITALNAHLGETVAPGETLISVSSTGGSKAQALVVPESAVIREGGQAFVYVRGNVGTTKTPVTTGLVSADGMVEIVSGLASGQEVLAFGN